MRYAEVAVNAPSRRTFDYHIPPEFEGELQPGHLVQVAFGTSMQPGIVVALHDTSEVEQTKPILDRLDSRPVISPECLALAQWMSHTYYAPLSACLWLMIPPGLVGTSTREVTLIDDTEVDDPLQRKIIDLLIERGALRIRQIQGSLKGESIDPAIKKLVEAGIVETNSVLSPPSAKQRTAPIVALAFSEDILDEALAGLRGPKQKRVLEYIGRQNEPLRWTQVHEATGATAADLRRLEEKGLVVFGEEYVWQDSLADRDFVPSSPPPLIPEQQAAWDTIRAQMERRAMERVPEEEPHTFLLHGVTGSGKTEIYLRAIDLALEQGRQAIFLVPEIALTAQTVRRVASRFGDRVAIVHGSLKSDERHDTWQRARLGEVGVVVGARSALFTPLPDVGVIILDEEHDHSYKQSPPMIPLPRGVTMQPYYHARSVAAQMAKLNNAILILGSATPDVTTMFYADQQRIHYVHLPRRIMGHRDRIQSQANRTGVTPLYRPDQEDAVTIDLPPVQVVDMRSELKAGNRSMFSRALHSALGEVLARKEQAILFLNRRGQATYVFCRDCGYVVECPRCDTPMTYHRHGEAMRCHHCGYRMPPPDVCPQCGSGRIKFFGAGTQQVENELRKAFRGARILRWDADTAKKPDTHEAILSRFMTHQADIMVGTQMIAKGLDLPLVTLVGVISADMGLALPDFRAGERTFQLLTQVSGRAGRGLRGGKVVLQTYMPDNYAVQFATQHDYAGFYAKEIRYRHEMGYPPYRRMVRFLFFDDQEAIAAEEAQRAESMLQNRIRQLQLTGTSIIGPAPCFFSRIDGIYRWQLLLRGPNPSVVLDGLDIPRGWEIDIDPVDVL